jgi:hypothetical protein
VGRREVQQLLTIAGFVEAMSWVAVRCEDGDLVPARLQRNSRIDNKTFGAANAEIRMEEDGVLLLLCHVGRVQSLQRVVKTQQCLRYMCYGAVRLDRFRP